MTYYRPTHCCGVSELSGITYAEFSPEEAVWTVCSAGRCPNQAMCYYIDVKKGQAPGRYTGTAGDALTEYILTNGLGRVFSTPWALNRVHAGNGAETIEENPTGHFNKTFTWVFDRKAMDEWCKGEDFQRINNAKGRGRW
jgi:hypothetical protein